MRFVKNILQQINLEYDILIVLRKDVNYLKYKIIECNEKRIQIENLNEILSQKFSYLNESSRAIVYISEDKKYVLKTFKNAEGIEKQFRSWGMDLGEVYWSPKPGDALGSAKIMYQNTIESYKLANEKLREETGLIYLHLCEETLPIDNIQLDKNTLNSKN